jgi:hypothetical protein
MSDKSQPPPSWWQTVPGILTGVAAIITAVTGLVIAFDPTGNRSEDPTPASLSASGGAQPPVSAADSRTPPPPQSGARAQSIALPPVNPVKLAGGTAVVTILSAEVEPLDAERRSLRFGLRYLNAGRYPANFWSASFRLIVADVPRAPTNLLDEVVEGESATEGEVMFEVPASVKSVVLQISSGDERSRIPFTLP